MNTKEIFINAHELPDPLSKLEVYELINKIRQGDKAATETLVKHNMKLVIHEVNLKFYNIGYEKKDLVSLGSIGLMKAVNSFDTSKNLHFSTYAIRCIDNEILMFLRKEQKIPHADSLDKPIGEENSNLKLHDIVCNDYNFLEKYEDREMYKLIRKIVESLPYPKNEIIMMYFGFYNKKYSQDEIAKKLSYSQTYICRLISKILEEIKTLLVKNEIMESTDEKVFKKH